MMKSQAQTPAKAKRSTTITVNLHSAPPGLQKQPERNRSFRDSLEYIHTDHISIDEFVQEIQEKELSKSKYERKDEKKGKEQVQNNMRLGQPNEYELWSLEQQSPKKRRILLDREPKVPAFHRNTMKREDLLFLRYEEDKIKFVDSCGLIIQKKAQEKLKYQAIVQQAEFKSSTPLRSFQMAVQFKKLYQKLLKKDIIIRLEGESFDSIDPQLMLKGFLDKLLVDLEILVSNKAYTQADLLFEKDEKEKEKEKKKENEKEKEKKENEKEKKIEQPTKTEELLLSLTILGQVCQQFNDDNLWYEPTDLEKLEEQIQLQVMSQVNIKLALRKKQANFKDQDKNTFLAILSQTTDEFFQKFHLSPDNVYQNCPSSEAEALKWFKCFKSIPRLFLQNKLHNASTSESSFECYRQILMYQWKEKSKEILEESAAWVEHERAKYHEKYRK